jgi:hypothetical protein|tara:strand:+ start:62 stop:355 length:294 start_codon:yes stop_codon:yes gene_type:complete
MSEEPEILYDKDGSPTYYSKERVREILIRINEFEVYRSSFEEDGKNANVVLGYIEGIRHLFPEGFIIGELPDHFRLSNKALGELEKKCNEALERESA